MSDILQIIKQRRSIRKFQDKKIPDEIVEKLKQALIWAPSAGNLQARKFYFISNQEMKSKLAKAYNYPQEFISQAPLLIVACTDEKKMERYGEKGKNVYLITDIASSIQNVCLLAYEQGLGTCWVGAFNEDAVSNILELSEYLRPVIMLPVGYPRETPEARPRVSVGEAVEEIK
jgi:nitroreductase